ncbi:threonine-phosphate decarboxylase CobD [Neptunomonas phycophila]|uniref:threonine-phosphate decarboxylase CobD n=1 Tax=Neptunomonas phycophila TaxID=1572645 RepID=UPI000948CC53|nr:threonine-phosphate decarboxylase CobD [Neptunomonas phycophila]
MLDSVFHGGDIRRASQEFDIALCDWLDLSTGINPYTYPLPDAPTSVWRNLPYDDYSLLVAAKRYYNTEHILPVAGSQQAIEIIPRLFSNAQSALKVAVLSPSYAEHTEQWCRYGHDVWPVSLDELESKLDVWDLIVVVRPNNPTTEMIVRDRIERWRQTLQKRSGIVIVDEAFMDAEPHHASLTCIQPEMPEGLIVLRSIGKFFGLAGIRLGFVVANPAYLNRLQGERGLWAVSGPALWAGQSCLSDEIWQQEMRAHLNSQSILLSDLLERMHLPHARTPLFCYVPTASAEQIYRLLAQQGILTRLFEHIPAIRIGLPPNQAAAHRLEAALHDMTARI